MGERQPAQPVRQPAQVVLPAGGGQQQHLGVGVELVDDQVHDPVDQVLPARDVAVERHGLHVELAAEAAHGQGGQAFAFDQRRRRAQDRLPVQPLTGWPARSTQCHIVGGFAAAWHVSARSARILPGRSGAVATG